jgi:hypothetical protein
MQEWLYLGGRVDSSVRNLDVIKDYDPQSDRWHRLSPPPMGRSGIPAGVQAGSVNHA